MLSDVSLPACLTAFLVVLRGCFTAPTFATFTALVNGFVRQTAAHTVCGMLTGAGLERVWHHSRAHRFFSHARWSADRVGLVLADLIVAYLVPPGAALTVAIDDYAAWGIMRRRLWSVGVFAGHGGGGADAVGIIAAG